MSSILKALKKLDEEKSARRAGIDVAKGIIKSVPARPPKRKWLFPVSVSGAAIFAALLTYVMMDMAREHGREAGRTETARTISAAKEAGDGKNEVKPDIAQNKKYKGGSLPATAVSRPVLRAVEKTPAKKPSPAKNSLSGSPQIPVDTKPPHDDRHPHKNSPAPVKSDSGNAQQPASISLPALRVSGIAWDRDGSERFAVVNGVSVGEGMTVGGAVVEKIFQDKVRFSFANRIFDVAVGNEMR